MNSSNLVEIILGILFVLFLSFVAYLIYNRELISNISAYSTTKKEIVLFEGVMDFQSSKYKFDTYKKSASSYKDLTPSINQNGGAEYSYNFWLYVDKGGLSVTSKDIVLLLRGDSMKIPYLSNTNCFLNGENNDGYYLVKNPLIRMKSDGSSLIVEYNTITSPDSYREYGKNATDCSSSSWYEKNKGMLGIYDMGSRFDKRWFMVTVVLQEINPDSDILYRNKTSCKMYINGTNVLDRVVESPYNGSYGSAAMKHNRGKLHVNPGETSIQEDVLKIANLSYFNYALSGVDIEELFQKKFTKTQALIMTDTDDDQQLKYQIANLDEKNLPLPF